MAGYLLNIKINNILNSIKKIKPITGRFEKIGNIRNKSNIILDYAHSPDALKTIITNIKEDFPLSKISLVFGCGGNRDKDKRAIMGYVASKYCDSIYLTDDNPRLENPSLIRTQIKKGLKKNKFVEIASRARAISLAIKNLKSGDILIVAGKGHEIYQEYKNKNFFSDKLEILKAIRKKNFNLYSSIKNNILREYLKKNDIKKNNNINFASINSKKINKNSIFIGIKGKRFNGNLFAEEAIKNKATIAISKKNLKTVK